MSSELNAQQGWPSSRIGGGLVASRRGLALAGLMLAGVGLWVALAFAVTFVVLGCGLFLIPGILLAVRSLAVPLGAVFVLLGLWTVRWLITAYFRWARLLLAPARSTGCGAETAGHWSVT